MAKRKCEQQSTLETYFCFPKRSENNKEVSKTLITDSIHCLLTCQCASALISGDFGIDKTDDLRASENESYNEASGDEGVTGLYSQSLEESYELEHEEDEDELDDENIDHTSTTDDTRSKEVGS